jgi:hypothetical protein
MLSSTMSPSPFLRFAKADDGANPFFYFKQIKKRHSNELHYFNP